MSASAHRYTCEQLGACQARLNCPLCPGAGVTHQQLHAHPHRQNYTPEPEVVHPLKRAAPADLARYAVYAALLLGALTVGAVLAGVLP